ncbi:MFS family permease [Bacillus pakistanensis]|uniref:MFS family permease n=1 Tax=Rossellomorea pakistanensis TaxID=992288 RepID=A0ABS2NIW8_9BACI|nr:MFS transporter [Bacillus pakistanensis]MBM7587802.1 MFS family permease [Bacillus pakistanensis]
MKKLSQFKQRYSTPVWIQFCGELLTSTTGAMLAPFLIIFLHDQLGGNLILPLIIVGLQPLTEIVMTLIGGGLTDRLGRKSIILTGLLLQAVAMLGFVFAESVWLFAFMYILNGVGRTFYIPAQRAQIVDSTEEKKVSEVFAVISTIASFGMTIGPLLGFLVYTVNPVFTFGFQAAALSLYSLLVWLKLPETYPKTKDVESKSSLTINDFFKQHYSVLGLMVFTLPISFFYAQTETNYRIYIEELFPDFLLMLTIMTTANAIFSILLEVLLVKWTERFKMKTILFISYSMYAVAAILYGFSDSLPLLILTVLVLTIAQSIGLNHLLRYVSTLAPKQNRGLYFSLYGIHWDISRTIGPLLGGVILIHWGGSSLFYLSAFLIAIGGIGQYIFVGFIEKGRTEKKKAVLEVEV